MTPLTRVESFGELDHGHVCSTMGGCRHPGARRPRLPLEPLLLANGSDNRSALARVLGLSVKTVQEWSRLGVPFGQADRAACALGLHPVSVWGPLWESVG